MGQQIAKKISTPESLSSDEIKVRSQHLGAILASCNTYKNLTYESNDLRSHCDYVRSLQTKEANSAENLYSRGYIPVYSEKTGQYTWKQKEKNTSLGGVAALQSLGTFLPAWLNSIGTKQMINYQTDYALGYKQYLHWQHQWAQQWQEYWWSMPGGTSYYYNYGNLMFTPMSFSDSTAGTTSAAATTTSTTSLPTSTVKGFGF